MFPKWVWAQRSEATNSNDRLGRTEAQILRMGRERWNALRDSGGDYGDIVFARCLYDRNRRMLSQLSPARRRLVVHSRTAVWLTANACIALQDVEDGGGTSCVHNPRYARIDVEELAFELSTGARPVWLRLPESVLAAHVRACLVRRATAKTWPTPTMFGPMPDMKEEQSYGALAVKHFDESMRFAARFGPAGRRAVLYVLDKWSIGEHEPGMFHEPAD